MVYPSPCIFLGQLHQFILQGLQSRTVTAAAERHDLVVVLAGEGIEYFLFLLHGHLAFHLLQLGAFEGLAPDNVKLAARTFALRIDLVAKSCRTKGSAFVVALWIGYLCWERIVGSACAEHLPRWCIAAIGVSALYHEVLDDTVEERAVVVALTGQFEEVVAVARRVVIEAYKNVALGSLDSYFAMVVVCLI